MSQLISTLTSPLASPLSPLSSPLSSPFSPSFSSSPPSPVHPPSNNGPTISSALMHSLLLAPVGHIPTMPSHHSHTDSTDVSTMSSPFSPLRRVTSLSHGDTPPATAQPSSAPPPIVGVLQSSANENITQFTPAEIVEQVWGYASHAPPPQPDPDDAAAASSSPSASFETHGDASQLSVTSAGPPSHLPPLLTSPSYLSSTSSFSIHSSIKTPTLISHHSHTKTPSSHAATFHPSSHKHESQHHLHHHHHVAAAHGTSTPIPTLSSLAITSPSSIHPSHSSSSATTSDSVIAAYLSLVTTHVRLRLICEGRFILVHEHLGHREYGVNPHPPLPYPPSHPGPKNDWPVLVEEDELKMYDKVLFLLKFTGWIAYATLDRIMAFLPCLKERAVDVECLHRGGEQGETVYLLKSGEIILKMSKDMMEAVEEEEREIERRHGHNMNAKTGKFFEQLKPSKKSHSTPKRVIRPSALVPTSSAVTRPAVDESQQKLVEIAKLAAPALIGDDLLISPYRRYYISTLTPSWLYEVQVDDFRNLLGEGLEEYKKKIMYQQRVQEKHSYVKLKTSFIRYTKPIFFKYFIDEILQRDLQNESIGEARKKFTSAMKTSNSTNNLLSPSPIKTPSLSSPPPNNTSSTNTSTVSAATPSPTRTLSMSTSAPSLVSPYNNYNNNHHNNNNNNNNNTSSIMSPPMSPIKSLLSSVAKPLPTLFVATGVRNLASKSQGINWGSNLARDVVIKPKVSEKEKEMEKWQKHLEVDTGDHDLSALLDQAISPQRRRSPSPNSSFNISRSHSPSSAAALNSTLHKQASTDLLKRTSSVSSLPSEPKRISLPPHPLHSSDKHPPPVTSTVGVRSSDGSKRSSLPRFANITAPMPSPTNPYYTPISPTATPLPTQVHFNYSKSHVPEEAVMPDRTQTYNMVKIEERKEQSQLRHSRKRSSLASNK